MSEWDITKILGREKNSLFKIKKKKKNSLRKNSVCEVDKLQTKGKPNLLVSDTKKISTSTSRCQRDCVNRLKQREVAGGQSG